MCRACPGICAGIVWKWHVWVCVCVCAVCGSFSITTHTQKENSPHHVGATRVFRATTKQQYTNITNACKRLFYIPLTHSSLASPARISKHFTFYYFDEHIRYEHPNWIAAAATASRGIEDNVWRFSRIRRGSKQERERESESDRGVVRSVRIAPLHQHQQAMLCARSNMHISGEYIVHIRMPECICTFICQWSSIDDETKLPGKGEELQLHCCNWEIIYSCLFELILIFQI